MLTTEGTDFQFPEAGPEMFTLTCVNHPEGKWLTKNPSTRSLHWIGWNRLDTLPDMMHPTFSWKECPCPYADLRVVLSESTR